MGADTRSRGPWAIALAGMVSLGVAMGIGRFAFTPILPMMLADGVLDLPAASWLASANYLGYLVGAPQQPQLAGAGDCPTGAPTNRPCPLRAQSGRCCAAIDV